MAGNLWEQDEVVAPSPQTGGGGQLWQQDEVVAPANPHAAAQADPLNPDAHFQTSTQAQPTSKAYTGKIIPFSVDAEGNKSFDPRAGVLAPYTKGAEITKGAMTGRRPIDYNNPEVVGNILGTAMAVGPPAARIVNRAMPEVPSSQTLKASGVGGLQGYRNSNQLYDVNEYRDMLKGTASSLKKRRLHRYFWQRGACTSDDS